MRHSTAPAGKAASVAAAAGGGGELLAGEHPAGVRVDQPRARPDQAAHRAGPASWRSTSSSVERLDVSDQKLLDRAGEVGDGGVVEDRPQRDPSPMAARSRAATRVGQQ